MSDQYPPPENDLPREPVRVKMPNRKPIITYTLLGLTVLFFVLQQLLRISNAGNLQIYIPNDLNFLFGSPPGGDFLFSIGGKYNEAIINGQFWRLLTPALLHGSIMHIGFNMYALYIFGSRLERFYGHGRFLLLYLLSAFAGNVLSFVLTPAPSLGASTAIFGLLAADGVFIFQNRKLFGPAVTRQAMLNMAFILVINLAYGFTPGTNIDNMGHIGGLIGGAFFAWKAGPMMKISGQPPFFDVVDNRKTQEVLLAFVIVAVGFIIIASIPFLLV